MLIILRIALVYFLFDLFKEGFWQKTNWNQKGLPPAIKKVKQCASSYILNNSLLIINSLLF